MMVLVHLIELIQPIAIPSCLSVSKNPSTLRPTYARKLVTSWLLKPRDVMPIAAWMNESMIRRCIYMCIERNDWAWLHSPSEEIRRKSVPPYSIRSQCQYGVKGSVSFQWREPVDRHKYRGDDDSTCHPLSGIKGHDPLSTNGKILGLLFTQPTETNLRRSEVPRVRQTTQLRQKTHE